MCLQNSPHSLKPNTFVKKNCWVRWLRILIVWIYILYRWQCRCWVVLGGWAAGKGSRARLALLAGSVALTGPWKVPREFHWGQRWGGGLSLTLSSALHHLPHQGPWVVCPPVSHWGLPLVPACLSWPPPSSLAPSHPKSEEAGGVYFLTNSG